MTSATVLAYACLFLCYQNDSKTYGWIFIKVGDWIDYGVEIRKVA